MSERRAFHRLEFDSAFQAPKSLRLPPSARPQCRARPLPLCPCRETLSAVTAFLKELPQKQRDLFVRRYWYSSDIGTLSELFDRREVNVKMTLSRLRKRLKNYLEKEGLL